MQKPQINFGFVISPNEIEAIEDAVWIALEIAYKEKEILGEDYTEENLRYTVMLVLSYIKHFGSYPNDEKAEYHLCFQKHYSHTRTKGKEEKFIPDIVSLKRDRRDSYSVNPLVVELKKDGKIAPKKKCKSQDLYTRIEKLGTCIESDILKTRIYINKKDKFRFKYGVVINLFSDITPQKFVELEKMLQRQQSEYRANSSKNVQNLMFAWYNTELKEPEYFWFNEDDPITLGRK